MCSIKKMKKIQKNNLSKIEKTTKTSHIRKNNASRYPSI